MKISRRKRKSFNQIVRYSTEKAVRRPSIRKKWKKKNMTESIKKLKPHSSRGYEITPQRRQTDMIRSTTKITFELYCIILLSTVRLFVCNLSYEYLKSINIYLTYFAHFYLLSVKMGHLEWATVEGTRRSGERSRGARMKNDWKTPFSDIKNNRFRRKWEESRHFDVGVHRICVSEEVNRPKRFCFVIHDFNRAFLTDVFENQPGRLVRATTSQTRRYGYFIYLLFFFLYLLDFKKYRKWPSVTTARILLALL